MPVKPDPLPFTTRVKVTFMVNLVVPPPIDIFIGAKAGGDEVGGGENGGDVGVLIVRPAASAEG